MAKKHSYWAAPVLVLTVMLSVYAAYGLFPFGTGTISWCDMNQQVIPFLMDLKNILTGKANMFLNLQNAGGMSFWGVFLFFISSPFSFLVIFVDKAQMYLYVNLLLILKMMTCSLTASYYFNRRFSNLTFLQTSALSVMYAFCGYTMFYYQNIVWLDIMYLFPLLLVGLEKLIDEKKVLFYTLTFAAILTVNFYLTYMVTIFLILAFGTYLLICVPKQDRRPRILLFGLSTIVSGLLTGVVWMPSLLQYLASARTGDVISSLRSGGLLSRLDTTVAVVLCTGAIAAAVIMAIVLKKYQDKRVRWLFCILCLMLVPVFLEPVNKMWQTGSYQSFPVRYGYILIFLGLILFAVVISAINRENDNLQQRSFSYTSIGAAIFAVIAIIFCASVIVKFDFESVTSYTRTLWGDSSSFRQLLLFAVSVSFAYMILLLLYHYRRITRTIFSILLCAVTIVEASFYSNIYIASAKNNAQYYSPILDLSEKIQDDTLYRVKMDEKYFDVNLMGSMGYNSLSHYTSLTSKNYMFAMKKLGYSSYWMEVNSNGGTKLTDAILGNKYTVTKTDHLTKNTKPVYGNGLYSIVKNEMALPVGIVMKSSNIESLKNLPETTRLLTQQYLFQSVYSTSRQLFNQYQPTSLDNVTLTKNDDYQIAIQDQNYEGTISYKIPVSGTQTLYFDCFDQLTNKLYEHINSSFSITVNGKILDIQYPTQPNNGLVNLGTYSNQTVNVEIGILRDVYEKSFGIAGLKDDVLSSAVNQTAKASLKQSGNSIIGTVSADSDDDYLFLPINYNSGYTASVNGSPAQISCVFDTFMAVKLKKGFNQVSVSCVPQGFWQGLALTVLGVLFLLLLFFGVKSRKIDKLHFLETPASVAFCLLCVLTFAAVYIFSLVVYCM
ncbi:MAG TPA: YfhO family protein [Caproicibacter sp.]|nr:YfhO family protein [Caproicibacter sp.]